MKKTIALKENMNSGGCIIEAPRRQAGILCFTAGKTVSDTTVSD